MRVVGAPPTPTAPSRAEWRQKLPTGSTARAERLGFASESVHRWLNKRQNSLRGQRKVEPLWRTADELRHLPRIWRQRTISSAMAPYSYFVRTSFAIIARSKTTKQSRTHRKRGWIAPLRSQ